MAVIKVITSSAMELALSLCSTPSFASHPESQSKTIDDSVEAERHCSGNTIDQMICEGNIYNSLDRRMNALYKEQMSRLEPDSQVALKASQRAWIIFRDKACLYENGPRRSDGNSWNVDQSFCLANYTRQRIDNLKSYLACTDNGCPR